MYSTGDIKEIYSLTAVRVALDKMADDLNRDHADKEFLALTLLNGAVVFAGNFVPLLTMPLRMDYAHATRYRNQLQGSTIQLLAGPSETIAGCDILILDDIFDRGETLQWMRKYCLDNGARSVCTAVLAMKNLQAEQRRPDVQMPDYCALTVPDEFVFGFGMDAGGRYRNLPGIYYLNSDEG